jgi:SAM-dependent methyltransferase
MTQDWTAGYVADIGYTYGYYPELNPLRVGLALANQGLMSPSMGSACELGFGQGLSVNLHAAGSPVKWWGTDFNPAQAGFAQELADQAGSQAQLFDQAFAQFCAREDLPEFDFIGLHGIWSWISDDNRRAIVDFLARKLRVGGVLYISYNTLPGWGTFAPMRHLMTEHAEVIGAEGRGIVNRINDAIEFSDKLLATNPLFLRANPQIAERIKKLKDQNRHYLAHEYFNRDWHPMHFATMRDWLEPAKLSYAASAHFFDHIEPINLTQEQIAFLRDIPDPMFRESVRDFMVNQQFRRDYWVKGPRRMNPLQQTQTIKAQRVVLVSHRADVTLKVAGAAGEATLNESVYAPILDLMSDHAVRSVEQIHTALEAKGLTLPQAVQAVVALIGAAHFAPVQSEAQIVASQTTAKRANAALLARAEGSQDIQYMASPVTGGGFAVSRFQQLFLRAESEGKTSAADLAASVWAILKGLNQKIIKEGKQLESDAENLAELQQQAETYIAKQRPILHALQIV